MAKRKPSKRYRQAAEMVDADKSYTLEEAVGLLKQFPRAKFDETVDLAFRLGVDPRQSDQMVRDTVPLPHGSGKDVRVVVFATSSDAAEAAKEAGAFEVGFEDLIERVTGGWVDFDVAVATPEAMAEVRKLGRVLGPRGLMPNPRTGTVTDDTAKAVKELKAGRIDYKVDKTSNLHVVVGKASFESNQLVENIRTVFGSVVRAKPESIKGTYLKSCAISSAMSPAVRIDLKEVTEAA